MRIGIVGYWFNRGQGVVARHLRAAFDALGHETFVLARPTRASNLKPSFVDSEGVWDQSGVTAASAYEIPWSEYEAWAADNSIEAAFFDQNYQLDEIARLRRGGVRTIGRFVWEAFSEGHVGPATEAMDVIYSLTRAERERYAGFGIESPLIPWGCPPELLEVEARRDPELVKLIYPGGFMSARKPFEAVLKAFRATEDPRLRLVFKAQVPRGGRRVQAPRAPRRPHRGDLRGPRHRRIPPALRELRRLPRAEPLGGPRPSPLRGDGVRDADHHQRQPADERARHRRRQRAAWSRASRRAKRSRAFPRSSPTSAS